MRDAELTERITQVHTRSHGTHGAPRVHAALERDGTGRGASSVNECSDTGTPGRVGLRARAMDTRWWFTAAWGRARPPKAAERTERGSRSGVRGSRVSQPARQRKDRVT
ncbi:IS3 family transposase [Streptomyces sp.]|uniref:IS3 family transposase n=1 Tax=Streptomyces sp. TaxID=1931 RepID=UPI0039C93081